MNTTYDLYRAFLDGIRKGGTFSIDVNMFNRLINEWGQDEWIKQKVIYSEIDQNLMDKLNPLKVITDGVFEYSERIDKSGPYKLKVIKNNPSISPVGMPNEVNYFTYPAMNTNSGNVTINGVKYPVYMRLLNIEFKIKYLPGNLCKKTGISEWLDAEVLRSDTETSNKKNPYRKPNSKRLYYELFSDSVKLTAGEFAEGYEMKIKYYKYPRRIFLNKLSTNSTDEQLGIPDYTGATNGSINCELHYPQRKEIVDLAVRIFLERVKDQRYQSFLNEINFRRNG